MYRDGHRWVWVGISVNGWILVDVGGHGWSGVDIYPVSMYLVVFAIFHLNVSYGLTGIPGDHIHWLKAIFSPPHLQVSLLGPQLSVRLYQ